MLIAFPVLALIPSWLACPQAASSCAGVIAGSNPLQQAIDAAAPGDVIDVAGLAVAGVEPNYGQPICINKPLTLLGPARLSFEDIGPFGVVNIADSVQGTVVLRDLTITASFSHEAVPPLAGVHGASFDATLVLDGCVARGPDFGQESGDGGPGGPGIRGAFRMVVVLDSVIEGGDAEPAGVAIGGNGGVALEVGAEVVLVNSTLHGGKAGGSYGLWPGSPPESCLVLQNTPGTPGSPVSSVLIRAWGSLGDPGAPAERFDCTGNRIGFGARGAPLPPSPIVALRVGSPPSRCLPAGLVLRRHRSSPRVLPGH